MAKTKSKPEMGPSGSQNNVKSTVEEMAMPTENAPQGTISSTSAEVPAILAGSSSAAPVLPLTESGVSGVAAWLNNKKLNGLWSINQDHNSWIGVQGIGWKKLSDSSDSGIVALTMLSAHAFEKGSVVNYREESDGKVHEMYVW